jgi:hypothetical protein
MGNLYPDANLIVVGSFGCRSSAYGLRIEIQTCGNEMADIEGSNGQKTEFQAVGRAKFGTEAVVPGMLHAKFLRSPYGRVKIKSLDVSKAKALEGMPDIVTWDDPEVIAVNPGLTSPPINTSPENLDTRNTRVCLKSDPGKSYPFGKFIADEGFGDRDLDIAATIFGRPPLTTYHEGGHVLDVLNTSFCEVAVDTETGETRDRRSDKNGIDR